MTTYVNGHPVYRDDQDELNDLKRQVEKLEKERDRIYHEMWLAAEVARMRALVHTLTNHIGGLKLGETADIEAAWHVIQERKSAEARNDEVKRYG